MRQFVSVALLCALVGLALPGLCAMQNEPDGFAGVKLGADFSSLNGLDCYTDSEDAKVCARAADALDYEGLALRSLTYTFMSGKLYMIELTANGQESFDKFKDSALKNHGRPQAEGPGRLYFEGKKTDVLVEYDKLNNLATLSFASRFIWGCPAE